MTPALSVALAAPYPEGAIMQLAGHWQGTGQLATLMRPSRAVNRMVSQLVSPLDANLAERISKGAEVTPHIRELAPQVELMRLLSRSAPTPSAFIHSVAWGKGIFDRAVAYEDSFQGAGALIAMAEASLESFLRYDTVCRVLHQVDAHPRYHNEVLEDVYGRRQARDEIYSSARVERMEAELEIADWVLVPSRLVADKMVECSVPEAKILRVPYGVDLEKFQPRRAETDTRPGSRKPRVVYVGQISLRKGIPFLLEAARRSGIAVDLIGPVTPGKPLPKMSENVRYVGTLSHGRLSQRLNTADAFVFPSLEDACPFSPLEAAATGLPVIITPSVGSGELFAESEVRWVREADVLDLAEALREVRVLSWEERQDRARRLRSGDVCKVQSWARYATEVYQQLKTVAG